MKKSFIELKSGIRIGHGQPCFVVAEIGNNHQGELSRARDMVNAAHESGVQAVKFQKRDTEALLTLEGRNTPYTGKASFGPTYGEHRDALELSIDEMAELKELSESLGLVFFTSAWDHVSLAQMDDLGVELLKFSSADLTSLPLIIQAAKMNIPIIISTGMSNLEEVDKTVDAILDHHNDLVILHCNSTYPCPECEIGLPVMDVLKERYGLPVGYSGHERGIGPSVGAAALGACVVERHFTMDKNLPGTDHAASLEPAELELMIKLIREVERSKELCNKVVCPGEMKARTKLRKSIIFARDLPAGHVITPSDVTIKCPGTGVSPAHWDDVLGTVLNVPVKLEDPFAWDKVSATAAGENKEARMAAK